ncbi:hypothetical protein F2Q70_00017958 [Brassica cretica]|uniref:Uncharacterized protein n=1 Tax=Brassica cretica TaxID=69181 RepID=A0A8S9HWW1_BRACR|nr:hypothetical protein F2Q70_00017958 [Brassica cretica]KAF2566110.1 hypothetical protein F2Q68_00026102 [Brassica cretica]
MSQRRKRERFAPESDVERSEVVRSAVIKEYREKRHCSFFTSSFSVHRREWNDMLEGIPPKPPAPADKPAVLSADHEGDF